MQKTPFTAPFIVELIKLNRSLAALLAIIAPSLIGVFFFVNALRTKDPVPWSHWIEGGAAIWAYFLLPMTITALAALLAQMEHAPKTWDHLRALAQARWRIYAAKAASILLIVAAMSALLILFIWGSVTIAGIINPIQPYAGAFDTAEAFVCVARIGAAATLLIAIQFWVAMRFSSFVPTLAIGVSGVFFGIVAPSAKAGVFSPWQMPLNTLDQETWRSETAFALGAGLGAIVLIFTIVHLAWREAK